MTFLRLFYFFIFTYYRVIVIAFCSNLYVRRVRAGEFVVVNRHLVSELVQRELWTPEVSLSVVVEERCLV